MYSQNQLNNYFLQAQQSALFSNNQAQQSQLKNLPILQTNVYNVYHPYPMFIMQDYAGEVNRYQQQFMEYLLQIQNQNQQQLVKSEPQNKTQSSSTLKEEANEQDDEIEKIQIMHSSLVEPPQKRKTKQSFQSPKTQLEGQQLSKSSPSIMTDEKDSSFSIQIQRKIKKSTKKNQTSQRYISKETQNILKNFVNAIIHFILKREESQKILSQIPQSEELVSYLKTVHSSHLNKSKIKMMFSDKVPAKQKKLNKMFRIICYDFLKNQSVNYIYSSKIQKKEWHLNQRHAILKIIACPEKTKNQKK